MEKKWSIRQFREGDEIQLRELTELVFGRRLTEEYWNWEFRYNPAGFTKTWVAVVGNEIVGQYTVIPMRLKIQDKVILATLSVDTMTHPNYRHQGMFKVLAAKLYEEIGKEGIPITYGFPNEASLPGFIKRLDWAHICTMPILARPLNFANILGKFIGSRFLISPISIVLNTLARIFLRTKAVYLREGLLVSWIKKFDDRMNLFWERLSKTYNIIVVRDRDYLNWRYFENPERDYRVITVERNKAILGYAVLRCMERFGLKGGMIVDILTLPNNDNVFHILVSESVEYFIKENMDLVTCLIHGDKKLGRLLRTRGFISLPEKIGFKKWYFGARLNNDTLKESFIENPIHWFLTFGDTDII